jgi:hypothetical protein
MIGRGEEGTEGCKTSNKGEDECVVEVLHVSASDEVRGSSA